MLGIEFEVTGNRLWGLAMFNNSFGLGIAPAIVPAIGYRYKNVFAEFAQLGLAAGMINVGITF
jgi:hypothetical protein